MIIQHNLPAMNANRMLGVNNRRTANNLEKLTSGFRINRAADDAAGLAISEKMRGQIRGLSMAETNVQHGISMIQTAEGGTQEIHSLLQRMRELSVQSSNGTYQIDDRDQLDKEYQALKDEITRIAESTHFNGIHLLAGKSAGIAGPDGSSLTAYPGSKMQVLDALTGGINSVSTNNHGVTVGGAFTGETVTVTDTNQALQLLGWPAGIPADFGVSYTAGAPSGSVLQFSFERDQLGVWTVSMSGAYSSSVPVPLTGGAPGGFPDSLYPGHGDHYRLYDNGGYVVELTMSNLNFLNDANSNADSDVLNGKIVYNFMLISSDGWDSFAGGKITLNSASATLGERTGQTEQLDFKYDNDTGWSVTSAGNSGFSVTAFDGQFVTLTSGSDNLLVDVSKLLGGPDDDRIVSGGFSVEVDLTSNAVTVIDDTSLKHAEAWMLDEEGGMEDSGPVILQICANGSADQRLAVNRFNLRSTNLGDANTKLSGSNIATQENANNAIDIIDKAINQVSSVRAYFGATQNRLEHTLNNLGVTKENLTAAESTIRDVDMAKEMMEFTKNNILIQASQSMLAQANQMPQGVLSLLR